VDSTPFAQTPEPPYYAVIFSSQRTAGDRGYHLTAERMVELAAQQPGYLGIESVRDTDGFGITVSYWSDLDSIRQWKNNMEHQAAQATGKKTWYADYFLRISRVERDYTKTSSKLLDGS
jgi:heme-degrading monooxygenase HmoA